jgi:tetratricopeptide (TPR) repeat protein
MSFRLFAVLALLLIPAFASACLWDYDTLAMERQRFPNALELITGKFLRHTKEFYEWRIKDRIEKLKADPENLAYLDDLAVAYEKTGDQAKAIETILRKDKIKPGLYETEANLGTFYLHDGQHKKGLEHIERALRINPDAHFGREKYQKSLAEWVASRRKEGRVGLPLAEFERYSPMMHDFKSFLEGNDPEKRLSDSEREAAIKGILGIMKFGNYESPVVLEALGSLLSAYGRDRRDQDAKQLAARAYLKAADVTSGNAREEYRKMAMGVLSMQTYGPGSDTQLPLEVLEKTFRKELAEAEAWYEQVHQDELTWINEGKNPEVEFDRKYYEPTVGESSFTLKHGALIGALVLALGGGLWKLCRRSPTIQGRIN